MRRPFSRGVHYVPQMEVSECGAACLAMVLDYHGASVTLEALRGACGAGRDGVSARSIVSAAQDHGLDVTALALELDELDDLACPAILHWEFNHFVVLERYLGDEGARIVDPASGPRRVSRAQLTRSFTGVALSFDKGPSFRRRSRRGIRWARYHDVLRTLAPGLAAVLLSALSLELVGLVLPGLTQVIIDHVLATSRARWLWPCAAVGVLGIGATVLLTTIRDRVTRRLHCALDCLLMERFVSHLLQLPLSFFGQRAAGDLLSRVEAQRSMRELVLRALTAALDGALVLGYGAMMLLYSVRVGLTVVALGLLRVAVVAAQRRHLVELGAAQLTEHGKELSVVLEALSAPELMRANHLEQSLFARHRERLTRRLNSESARERCGERAAQLSSAIDGLTPATVFLLAGREAIDEQITLGAFAGLMTLQQLFQAPLSAAVDACLAFARAKSSFARMDDVYDAEPVPAGTVDLPAGPGTLALQRVSFGYDVAGRSVCESLDLTIAGGEHVALVGASGQGKSTLLRLLAGLVTPSAGRVLLDGRDVRELSPSSLRAALGIVLQEPFLIDGTVRENLLLGHPGARDEDLAWAARTACIDDVIEALPQQYETWLGTGGRQLSGGERQRLCLARALVGRPRVLLLDEATSALDLALERRVQSNLTALGCTRIVAAHRLHTIAESDRILVVERGKVVESGRFAQLSRSAGFLRQLGDAR